MVTCTILLDEVVLWRLTIVTGGTARPFMHGEANRCPFEEAQIMYNDTRAFKRAFYRHFSEASRPERLPPLSTCPWCCALIYIEGPCIGRFQTYVCVVCVFHQLLQMGKCCAKISLMLCLKRSAAVGLLYREKSLSSWRSGGWLSRMRLEIGAWMQRTSKTQVETEEKWQMT